MIRTCIVACTNPVVNIMVHHLPSSVAVVAKIEMFDRPWTTLRLEGPGLPDWCEHYGNKPFAAGTIHLGGDGIVRVSPVESAGSLYGSAQKQFGNKN